MRTNKLFERGKRLMMASGVLLVTGVLAAYVWRLEEAAAILLTASAVTAGSDIAIRAWNALRGRHISIELLVTVAAAGALLIGEHVEAAAVTFLFLLGAHLETRTMRRTRKALEDLLQTAPERAFVVRDTGLEEVAVQDVEQGDKVRVRPGARVPVDGVVTEGHSAVDEATITGEPLPAEKVPGARVYAGTVNRGGVLDVRATGVGSSTVLARIIRRVEEAQEAQLPVQRLIERFARWYTPAMMGLSGLTMMLTLDVHLALTLLVIACPGALVIATPVAIAAGIGRAARRGILIKGGAHLETVGQVSALVLDKTGTLTEGRPRLTDVVAFEPAASPTRLEAACSHPRSATSPEDRVLCWAALAEADAGHPIGVPIVAEAEALGTIPGTRRSEAIPGRGVRAAWKGHEVVVGREDWIRQLGIAFHTRAGAAVTRFHEEGKTGVLVAVDGAVHGAIGVADRLREMTPAVIEDLQKVGIGRIVMATGDDARAARLAARQARITEVHARQMPEDKLNLIRTLQQEGHVVAFVGDGINDAPAVAEADVGIAMGTAGSEVAVEAADIALMKDELTKIPEAIQLSRMTLRVIRQNLAIAVVTVVILLAGVLSGTVHMGGGMLVHEASLLVVVFNSMRLLSTGSISTGRLPIPTFRKTRTYPSRGVERRPAHRAVLLRQFGQTVQPDYEPTCCNSN